MESKGFWGQLTQWVTESAGLGCVLVVVVLACSLVGGGVYVYQAYLNTHVIQPNRLQNLNHDADWIRATQADFTSTYQDFQAAKQRVPTDALALRQFKQDNGPAATWNFTQAQEYNNLLQAWVGDYQAEARLANHYDDLAINPNTAPYKPAGLPDALSADAMPANP